VYGATSTNSGGYGLHIMNMSNGTNAFSDILKDTWRYATVNEVCMVASRGNYFSASAPGNNTALHYPACFSDPWVINVGASNFEGTRKIWGDGFNPDEQKFESYYNNEVDMIAPGGRIQQTYTTSIDSTYSPTYEYFYQTSASAAYVSGVAGLMMSQQNGSQLNDPQNLALEDIEHLIQNYADSVTDDGVGGSGLSVPNIYAGWGKLNAEKVMKKLDYPMWQVYHSGTPTFETVISATYNTQVIFSKNISELNLANGNYFVDRYKVQQTYIITFPPSVTVVDNWLRVNPSGFSGANPNGAERWCDYSYSINASNQVTVVMNTFSYKILTTTGGSVINQWVPFPADEVITRFSLLLYDPNNTGIEEITADNSNWVLYPNPATNQITLAISFPEGSDGQWTVLDLYGRSILYGRLENLNEGINYLTIPVENLASGVYFCNLAVDGKSSTKKFIVK